MEVKKREKLHVFVIFAYLVMVLMNALANILPINGRNTGDISDFYGNLFAPFGLTFAIWGLIYLLLLVYSVYQIAKPEHIQMSVSILFVFSSFANAAWILAWHYDAIGISVFIMLSILVCLILINLFLRKQEFNKIETFFIKVPFLVYFGWITVATIANITTYLVSIGWNRFEISEVIWTCAILLVGALIGFITELYFKSISYGLVLLWAYAGIGLKHYLPEYFNMEYPLVLTTVVVSMVIILIGMGLTIRNKMIKNKAVDKSSVQE